MLQKNYNNNHPVSKWLMSAIFVSQINLVKKLLANWGFKIELGFLVHLGL